jgi:hypothetical protein
VHKIKIINYIFDSLLESTSLKVLAFNLWVLCLLEMTRKWDWDTLLGSICIFWPFVWEISVFVVSDVFLDGEGDLEW